eukprot:4944382-Prymnesium_polylepis.1
MGGMGGASMLQHAAMQGSLAQQMLAAQAAQQMLANQQRGMLGGKGGVPDAQALLARLSAAENGGMGGGLPGGLPNGGAMPSGVDGIADAAALAGMGGGIGAMGMLPDQQQ